MSSFYVQRGEVVQRPSRGARHLEFRVEVAGRRYGVIIEEEGRGNLVRIINRSPVAIRVNGRRLRREQRWALIDGDTIELPGKFFLFPFSSR